MLGAPPPGWEEGFEQLRAFLKITTPKVAVPFGRDFGVSNFLAIASRAAQPSRKMLDRARDTYKALKKVAPKASRPTINIDLKDLKTFIKQSDYLTTWESGTGAGIWTGDYYQISRRQAETALGTYGLNPIYGAMTSSEYGAKGYGDAMIEVKRSVIMDRAILVAGDSFRILKDANVTDPRQIMYHVDWMGDARAAALLLDVPRSCLSSNPRDIANCILEGSASLYSPGRGERAYTEFHLFGGLTLDDIAAFHLRTQNKAIEVAKVLAKVGRDDIPIYAIGSGLLNLTVPGAQFRIGDRVVFNTGAVGKVKAVRPIPATAAQYHPPGATVMLEVGGMKGASPRLAGWSFYDDVMNLYDTDIVRVLQPREKYRVPELSLHMAENRKIMRAAAKEGERTFRERWQKGIFPFGHEQSSRIFLEEAARRFPGNELMQRALDDVRSAGWHSHDQFSVSSWQAPLSRFGAALAWLEAAANLGVEIHEPMVGAPLGTPPFGSWW